MRTTAQHRLDNAPRRLRAAIAAPIAWLQQRVVARANDLAPTLRASPGWRERETLSRRVPGMGPLWAQTLIVDRPEWGT
jgi:hypothetical protein